jgi:hypothetical protein
MTRLDIGVSNRLFELAEVLLCTLSRPRGNRLTGRDAR